MPHVCFPSTSRHLARRSQENIIQRWFHRFVSVDPFPAEMCLLIFCRAQEIATLNALNAPETGQLVAFCPQSVCINWKHNHPNVVWSIYIGPIPAETGSSYAGLECGKLPPWMHRKFVKFVVFCGQAGSRVKKNRKELLKHSFINFPPYISGSNVCIRNSKQSKWQFTTVQAWIKLTHISRNWAEVNWSNYVGMTISLVFTAQTPDCGRKQHFELPKLVHSKHAKWQFATFKLCKK